MKNDSKPNPQVDVTKIEMTTLETLEAARKLILFKKRWITGVSARGKSGMSVSSLSRHAVCFCSAGAIWRAASGNNAAFWDAIEALNAVISPSSLPHFNDTHTHAEVLAAFDAAIAKLVTHA